MKKLITISATILILLTSCSKKDECNCIPVTGGIAITNGETLRYGIIYVEGAMVEECYLEDNISDSVTNNEYIVIRYELGYSQSVNRCSGKNASRINQ